MPLGTMMVKYSPVVSSGAHRCWSDNSPINDADSLIAPASKMSPRYIVYLRAAYDILNIGYIRVGVHVTLKCDT